MKKVLCLLLCLAMTVGLMAGCGSTSSEASGTTQTKSGDPIKLTVYSQTANWSGSQTGWGATLLKDKFNIELTIIPDSDGAYQTRVESGNLGDIVIWGSNGTEYQNAVNLGLLFDWEEDDLLADYGQDILDSMSLALESNREINSDGKIHGFGYNVAHSADEHEDFFYDWGIRWDLYKELGYPEVKDWDDLLEVFSGMKEICPTDDNGNPTYALSVWPDWDGDMVMYVKSMASGYYGYDELGLGLYDSKTGDFHDALETDGPYMESLKFFNDLYRAKLLDPDSMTQNFDAATAKVRNGGAFFSLFSWAGSGLYNSDVHVSEGKRMASLIPEDASVICYGTSPYGRERIWSIGSKSVYPEECMELLNWLCTPDGAMTIWYGIRGLMWDYDEDGNTYFTELGQACSDDPSYDLSGVEWTSPDTGVTYTLSGTFNDGMLQFNNTTWAKAAENPDSNGETYDYTAWKSQIGDAKSDIEQDWRDFTGCDTTEEYIDSTNYTNVPATNFAVSEKSSELEVKWSQVTAAIREYSWKAIYAEDDAEFESIVSEMIEKCNSYGYDECVEWCREQAAARYAMQ